MQQALQSVHMQGASELDQRHELILTWGQPFRSWLAAGLLVIGGSDCPAVVYDPDQPMLGLWATFSQETLAGVLMPEEIIDRETALRIWTINNARATGEQDLKGTIQPGKLADLAVLSGDPLTAPDADFRALQVCQTLVGGQTVYEG